LKNRSLPAQLAAGFLLALFTFGLTACRTLYYVPSNQYAGRPIPPSKLLERVLVTFTTNGQSGGAQMIDGLQDLRTNIQNTIPSFPISGFSAQMPIQIINFPEEQHGYILSQTDGNLLSVNYSSESSAGAAGSFGPYAASAAAAPDGTRFVGANETAGILTVIGIGSTGTGQFSLNLPNVYKVVINQGDSVILAMVRNSNTLYRVVKLPATNNPIPPPGSVDCQPFLLPVYCVVPVKGTFDRPTDAYFSTDGSTAYVLNCGPECGGQTASVAALQVNPLIIDNIPTADPLAPSSPTTMQTLPVANPIPVPGGVTAALSDGTNLYLSGQSLFSLGTGGVLGTTPRADGLFTGYLSTINLSTYAVSNPISISDGTHTKMLFADDSTLWIGSKACASGERAKLGMNYNCLTRVALGSTLTAQIVPNVTPGGSPTLPFPNNNQNPYYYGDLTGICWVQNWHKVYTAYGGQVHAFYTSSAEELNNTNFKIQGNALDVAYMDALTNSAN
jgi:hypothetical protein